MAEITVELLKRAAEYAAFRVACIKDTWELFQGTEECLEGLEFEQHVAEADVKTFKRLADLVGKAEMFFVDQEGPACPVASGVQCPMMSEADMEACLDDE